MTSLIKKLILHKEIILNLGIMGFMVLPICNKCGYRAKSIAIGGGRFSHLTQCGLPALNIESNEIEEINLYDYKKEVIVKKRFLYFFTKNVSIETKNDKYIPYYESSMFVDDLEIKNHQWGNIYYKQNKNFCPKCKSYDLDFVDEGIMFD